MNFAKRLRELEKAEPTASALIILAKYFEESVDYLLGLSE